MEYCGISGGSSEYTMEGTSHDSITSLVIIFNTTAESALAFAMILKQLRKKQRDIIYWSLDVLYRRYVSSNLL